MRKLLAIAIILVTCLGACNTRNAITEEKQTLRPHLSLAEIIPVKQAKTAQVKQQQKQFLEKNVKRFKSRKTGGAYYVAEAKRTFNEHNLDSASYYFGRAWLMDSTNNDIYWGYGMIYGQQQVYDKALFALYHALENDKENPRLLTDIATSHLGRFYEENSLDDLQQSKKLLEQALKLAPKHADICYKLAVNSYYLQEYSKAWEYLHQSIKQDKDTASDALIAALLEKSQDPQGVYYRQHQ